MITIHLGATTKQSKPPDAIELRTPDEYPSIRLAIREAQELGRSLVIWVISRACDDWFWDLERFPLVELIDSSAASQLQTKLQVTALPKELLEHPTLIFDLGLLEIEEPLSPSEDIWSWAARAQLGNIWAEQKPSEQHFTQLVSWLAENDIPEAYRQFAQQRIRDWSQSSDRLRKAYLDLLDDPANRAISLICYKALEAYPEDIRLRWLKKHPWFSDVLIDRVGNASLRYNDVPRKAKRELSDLARDYWDSRLVELGFRQDTIDAIDQAQIHQTLLFEIQKRLDEMSGCLRGELEALIRGMEKILQYLPPQVPLLLSEKFAGLDEAQVMIQRFKSRLAPSFPNAPSDTWTISDWTEWAVYRYIPYRRWCILEGAEVSLLDDYTAMFENWLYDNYPRLLMEADTAIVSQTDKIVSDFLSNGYFVLWAFIDNLSNLWRDEFEDALEQAGLQIETSASYIAMLPTITEISKPSLLLGLTPKQYAQNKKGSLIEEFERTWLEKGYQTSVAVDSREELLSKAAKGPNLLLFQYTRLDKLLHDNLQDLTEKKSEISLYLSKVCQILREGLMALSQFGEAKIIVSTDHGCTQISKQIPPLQIPQFAEFDADMKKHRRYVRIKSLEHLNKAQWFALDCDQFELPVHYAVPKGRVSVDSYPLGLTHGGLTPEEVIIPGLICQLASSIERINLKVEHVSLPLRLIERVQPFELQIYNPFEMPLKGIQIHIPRYHGEFPSISKLEARSSVRVKGTVKLGQVSSSSEDMIPMRVLVEGLLENGRRINETVDVEVRVRKIYESEMDDLFGEI